MADDCGSWYDEWEQGRASADEAFFGWLDAECPRDHPGGYGERGTGCATLVLLGVVCALGVFRGR